MRIRTRAITKGLVGLAAIGVMALGNAAPATAAEAGAATGWEYAAANSTACSTTTPPNVTAGVHLPTDKFVLTNVVNGTTITININDSVAAPQGARAGVCGNPLLPIVPGTIPIASVAITGSSACTASANGTFARVDSAVTFTFSCGGSTWLIEGNMNICDLPTGTSPECALPGDPNPDPNLGNPNTAATGHLITTYAAAP